MSALFIGGRVASDFAHPVVLADPHPGFGVVLQHGSAHRQTCKALVGHQADGRRHALTGTPDFHDAGLAVVGLVEPFKDQLQLLGLGGQCFDDGIAATHS